MFLVVAFRKQIRLFCDRFMSPASTSSEVLDYNAGNEPVFLNTQPHPDNFGKSAGHPHSKT